MIDLYYYANYIIIGVAVLIIGFLCFIIWRVWGIWRWKEPAPISLKDRDEIDGVGVTIWYRDDIKLKYIFEKIVDEGDRLTLSVPVTLQGMKEISKEIIFR
jgi:hypothetical protein